ncbi:MAG: hypothetical protein ACREWG_11245 [Gammaproteobacteria bacterium]
MEAVLSVTDPLRDGQVPFNNEIPESEDITSVGTTGGDGYRCVPVPERSAGRDGHSVAKPQSNRIGKTPC